MDVKRYEARLRLLPCVVCVALGQPPDPTTELHHVGDGNGERNNWLQIPICDRHHQGAEGIHHLHRRAFFKKNVLSDFALLALTNKLYHALMP